jgi:hypothetical protein
MQFTEEIVNNELKNQGDELKRLINILDTAIISRNSNISNKNIISKEYTDLSEYFPQSISELDIQSFNLTLKVPNELLKIRRPSSSSSSSSTLSTSNLQQPTVTLTSTPYERISTWLLETPSLNRESVGTFLTTDSEDDIGANVLEFLARKMCKIDAGNDFVQGLKIFLPVTGALDLELSSKNDSNLDESSVEKRRLKIITAYSKSHLSYSTSPIIKGGLTNLSVVSELAKLLVSCGLKTLYNVQQQQTSVVMQEFISSARFLLQHHKIEPLSIRILSDMFNSVIIGRPLIPFKLSSGLPTYLFSTRSSQERWILFGDKDDYYRTKLFARLCNNALYLFKSNDYDTSHPHSCIPLQNVQVQVGDGVEYRTCLELWPIDGDYVNIFEFGMYI